MVITDLDLLYKVKEINLNKLFSSVVYYEIVHLFLATAILEDWNIHNVDVKTAYLYDDLNNKIVRIANIGLGLFYFSFLFYCIFHFILFLNLGLGFNVTSQLLYAIIKDVIYQVTSVTVTSHSHNIT